MPVGESKSKERSTEMRRRDPSGDGARTKSGGVCKGLACAFRGGHKQDRLCGFTLGGQGGTQAILEGVCMAEAEDHRRGWRLAVSARGRGDTLRGSRAMIGFMRVDEFNSLELEGARNAPLRPSQGLTCLT